MTATARLRKLKVETLTVADLLDEVQAGRLRVPRFQRGLRWQGRHVRELFDSMYRGFPIGDLLLARKPAPADLLSFGPVQVDAPEHAEGWFIVDGQQRVTALVGALLHPEAGPRGDRYAVWFDLEAQQFVGLRGTTPPATWLPLNVLPDSKRLLRWISGWPLQRSRGDLVDRAFELSKAIREYRVPVYLLDGSDEEALRLVFKRTNTSGVHMSEVEVFDALNGRGEGA